jgi:GxxExxY protein
MSEFFYPELSYQLVGLSFEVHKGVGRFGKERDYAAAMESVMKDAGLDFKKAGTVRGTGYRLSFIVEGKIALVIRAKKYMLMDDYHKIRKCLHALDLQLALVFNFKAPSIQPMRIIKGGRPPGAPLPTIEIDEDTF